jgi:hypothetical protein
MTLAATVKNSNFKRATSLLPPTLTDTRRRLPEIYANDVTQGL